MIPTEITYLQYQLIGVSLGLFIFGISGLFVYLDRTGRVDGIERYGYSLLSRMSLMTLFLTLSFVLLPAPSEPIGLGGSTSIWIVPLAGATVTYVFLPIFFGASRGFATLLEVGDLA